MGCWPAGRTVLLSSLGGRCRWSPGVLSSGSRPGHRRLSGRAGSLAPPRVPAPVWWCPVPSQSLETQFPALPPSPGASHWCTGYEGSRGNLCRCVHLSYAAEQKGPQRLMPALASLQKIAIKEESNIINVSTVNVKCTSSHWNHVQPDKTVTSKVKRGLYVERGLFADGVDGFRRSTINGQRQSLVWC